MFGRFVQVIFFIPEIGERSLLFDKNSSNMLCPRIDGKIELMPGTKFSGSEDSPVKCSLQIFNPGKLSKEISSVISALFDKNASDLKETYQNKIIIQVYLGMYSSSPIEEFKDKPFSQKVFEGVIHSVNTERSGVDDILNLYCWSYYPQGEGWSVDKEIQKQQINSDLAVSNVDFEDYVRKMLPFFSNIYYRKVIKKEKKSNQTSFKSTVSSDQKKVSKTTVTYVPTKTKDKLKISQSIRVSYADGLKKVFRESPVPNNIPTTIDSSLTFETFLNKQILRYVGQYGCIEDDSTVNTLGYKTIYVYKLSNRSKSLGRNIDIYDFQNLIKPPMINAAGIELEALLDPTIKIYDIITLKLNKKSWLGKNVNRTRANLSFTTNDSSVYNNHSIYGDRLLAYTAMENQNSSVLDRPFFIVNITYNFSTHTNNWYMSISSNPYTSDIASKFET